HVCEAGARIPPKLGNENRLPAWEVSPESGDEEVKAAIVVVIAPRHGTFANSRQAGSDCGRHVFKSVPRVPPQLGNENRLTRSIIVSRISCEEEIRTSV